MNVLVLVRDLPWPPNTGARLRTLNLLSRLAHRHRITMVGYSRGDGAEYASQAEELHCLVAVPPPHQPSGLRMHAQLVANVASPLPYAVSKHLSIAMRQAVTALLEEREFDLVHCDSLPLAGYAALATGIPKVLTEHNVEAELWQRRAKHAAGSLRRAFERMQYVKMRRFEASACRLFDHCIAVSELDAATLRTAYGLRNVSVILNGVDTDLFAPTQAPTVPGRLVFTGSMDWFPNEDAMHLFASSIWPEIRRRRPHASMAVVGRRPSQALRRLCADKGLLVTGEVPDVRPYLAEAEAVVVPLRIGGGTRLKILEAMAMGKPVISSTVGAEGLAVTNGRDILLADEPAEFAEAVARVLTNPGLARSLGARGRELVERTYDWSAQANALHDLWLRVAGVARAAHGAPVSW